MFTFAAAFGKTFFERPVQGGIARRSQAGSWKNFQQRLADQKIGLHLQPFRETFVERKA